MLNYLKSNNSPDNSNKSFENIILETPNVFNYSPNGSIQYATKAFTPINLNLEVIASDPVLRKIVVDKLLIETNNYQDIDYICGIESGGTYFASAIADAHHKKLILLRRADKIEDDQMSRLVGETPLKGSRICFVDDVLSTGLTLYHAKKFFTNLGCKIIEAKIVFSYGDEETISKVLKMKIAVISNYPNLIKVAQEKKILSPKDVKKLNKFVDAHKNYLTLKKIV